MKKLRYFKCKSCSKITEDLVEDDIKSIKCECGKKALRQMSTPKFLGNTVGRNAGF